MERLPAMAAGMLKEFSVRYVILGHSERRQYQKESDELISKKPRAAHAAALKPIVCIGETLAERKNNDTEKVLATQVRGSLAGLTKEQMVKRSGLRTGSGDWNRRYGNNATGAGSHAFIRAQLAAMFDETVARKVRIQYGGSVKPSNAWS
jgi:triosephosphate isomerase